MIERHTACLGRLAVRVVDCLLCLALVHPSAPDALASEQTTDDAGRDEARQHYGRGLEFASQGEYAQALREFQEAYRSQPHFAVLYNIGQAYIALQQPVEAIAALEQYLAQGKGQIAEQRTREAAAQIAAEKAQTAEIRLAASPEGASVSLDGKSVGSAPLDGPIRVAPGRHSIAVRASDGTEVARDMAPQAGERITLSIEVPSAATTSKNERGGVALQRAELTLSSSSPALGRPASHDSSHSDSVIRISTLGYVLGGVGAVVGVGAFGHYLWNRNRYEDWKSTHAQLENNQQAPDYVARQLQNNTLAGSIQNASHVTVGLAVASGAFLVTGITFVIVDRGHRPTLTAAAQAGGTMLNLAGNW
jgi:tetratricopeptide (TPR) repeat protein